MYEFTHGVYPYMEFKFRCQNVLQKETHGKDTV